MPTHTLPASSAFSCFCNFLYDPKPSAKSFSAAGKVFNAVLTHLLSGRFVPGSRINEFELARTMKISNDRVREAMERLIYLGIVERIPNRGIQVREITLQEFEQIYQVRETIEMETVRKLAPVITDEQLEQLKQMSSQVLSDMIYNENLSSLDAEDPDTLRETLYPAGNDMQNTIADLQFHTMLIRFMENPIWNEMGLFVTSRLIMCYQSPLFRLPSTLFKLSKQYELDAVKKQGLHYTSHEEIHEALAAHDVQRAQSAMSRHLKVCYCGKKARMEFFKDLEQARKNTAVDSSY